MVFEAEYELLALQARSMQLYCPLGLIDSIIVIDNSHRPISPSEKNRIIEEYGDLAAYVTFLATRDVVQMPMASGWLTQQILKLMAVKFVQSERYIILDAKSHFVRKLKREFLEAPDGRARTKLGDYSNYPLRTDLERILSYFELRSNVYLKAFTPTVPPFVMYTDVVQNLIMQIVEKEQMPFEIAFIKLRFLEFFLYAAFILQRNLDLNGLYDFQQASCPILWEHTADERGCRQAITRANRLDTPFFALHRRAITKLSTSSINLVAEFWCDRKLFDLKELAGLFISDFRRSYILSQIHF